MGSFAGRGRGLGFRFLPELQFLVSGEVNSHRGFESLLALRNRRGGLLRSRRRRGDLRFLLVAEPDLLLLFFDGRRRRRLLPDEKDVLALGATDLSALIRDLGVVQPELGRTVLALNDHGRSLFPASG